MTNCTKTHGRILNIIHISASRAHFHAKAQRPVLVRLPHQDKGKHDGGKIGLLRMSMYGTQHAAGGWEREIGEATVKVGITSCDRNSQYLFHHEAHRFSGIMTYGDDLMVTGPTSKIIEL